MTSARFRDLPAIVPGKLDVFTADPRKIKVDPDYNCRDMNSAETIAHVDWLADEIESQGYNPEQPLTVKRRGDDMYVIRGHCRLAACMKVIGRGGELVGVPVMQIAAGTSDIDLIFDQEASNNGLRLDQFAKARLCLKARKAKVPDEEIARRMHWKSTNSVKEHIALLETPEALKQDVRDNVMSAGTALHLHRAHGEAAADIAAKAKAAAPTTGKKKGRVTPATVAKVTGKSSKQKQATDNLLNFVSVANKIEDEGKRAGGVERIEPTRLAALARETVTALAKAKGQSDTPQPEPHLPFPQPETAAVVDHPAPVGETAPVSTLRTMDQATHGAVHSAYPLRQNVKDLLAALKPFADLCNDFDANAKADDDIVEVLFADIKKAWSVYTAATGGSEEAQEEEAA